MSVMQPKSSSTQYLAPLTAAQMKDVKELIIYTEANRKPLRKPRIRKRDPNSTPRPINCFLVYRKEKQAQIAELCIGANHRVISKVVARWWKNIDPETKNLYVDTARQIKEDHAKKFPNYKYAPKRKHHSASPESSKPITTHSVVPGNKFFKKLDENDLCGTSTTSPAGPSRPKPDTSFDCAITQQFFDILCDPQSFSIEEQQQKRQQQQQQQNDFNGSPSLSQPLVDDSMAQYLGTRSWQINDNSNPALMVSPPQLGLDTTAAYLAQGTDWASIIQPQTTMIQPQTTNHPLDLVDPPNFINFGALGCGMENNVFWPLDTPPFMTVDNHNSTMLGMMRTPDLLPTNDSPLTGSSSYCGSSSFYYGPSEFIYPSNSIKTTALSPYL